MIKLYSYEELNDEAKEFVQLMEKSKDVYIDYLLAFRRELLLERLQNIYNITEEDSQTVIIEVDNYTIEALLTVKFFHVDTITVKDFCLTTDYNTEFKRIYEALVNDYETYKYEVKALEPDFGQYVNDFTFTEEGIKVKIVVDN